MDYEHQTRSESDTLGWPELIGIVAGVVVVAWFAGIPFLQRSGSPGPAPRVHAEQTAPESEAPPASR